MNEQTLDMNVEKLLSTFIEVTFEKKEDFLRIRETLTRIGILSKKDRTLWQSCHILHKRGKYYIVHFKELFALDGRSTDYSEDDIARRNTIAHLLVEWDLLKIVNPEVCDQPRAPLYQIKIVKFKDKDKWNLQSKYSIGRSK